MVDRQRLQMMVAQISDVLQDQSMRNVELLRAAQIDDYRAGEDAIWELVQQGRVRIEPDSKLTWVVEPNEKKQTRGASSRAVSRTERATKRTE